MKRSLSRLFLAVIVAASLAAHDVDAWRNPGAH